MSESAEKSKPGAGNLFASFCQTIGYLIFSLILAASVVELGAYALWTARHGLHPSRAEKLGSTSPAYKGYSWASDFWKEEAARRKKAHAKYEAFLLWRVAPWQGKFIHNDPSDLGIVRRTVNRLAPGCDERNTRQVWVFGGSTTYGSGVPDESTIPSYLSEDLNALPGVCAVVTNLGAEGYNTNQEIILLTELVKKGHHPDLAVFYDGFNDAYVGGFAPGFPDAHWDYAAIQARVEGRLSGVLGFLRNSYALRLVRDSIARRAGVNPKNAGLLESRAKATLDNYDANLQIATTLRQGYDFQIQAFWQPTLAFGSKPLDSYEQDLVKLDANSPEGSAYPAIAAVYREAERRERGGCVFLGHLFDRNSSSLYLDRWGHLAPEGNEIVARAITESIAGDMNVSGGAGGASQSR
jgi:lysophospholipase L1-like esterase